MATLLPEVFKKPNHSDRCPAEAFFDQALLLEAVRAMVSLLRLLSVVVSVMSQETCLDETSHVQFAQRKLPTSTELFWQGYGDTTWMFLIGMVGRDQV